MSYSIRTCWACFIYISRTEYCRLCKEVKELVREKKLTMWREVVEKANVDFEGSRKEFWAFVGRTKAKTEVLLH